MSIIFRTKPVSEPFAFESIGRNWDQDRVSRPKGYPFYHYLQTESGCGRISAAGKTYLLHENEGILFAPFLAHSYEKTSDSWFTCFASFTGTVESSIPQMLGNRQVILIDREQGERISPLIEDCVERYSHRPVDEKSLSISCYSLLMNFVDGVYTLRLADDPLYRSYVGPVMKEIERNYPLDLTVENLSRRVFITPQYLSRLFRRFLGCSTYEYLTAFRISRAKELLLSSPHLGVQDVARMTGFSDASHFIVMFKKTAGLTPLEFRKTN